MTGIIAYQWLHKYKSKATPDFINFNTDKIKCACLGYMHLITTQKITCIHYVCVMIKSSLT